MVRTGHELFLEGCSGSQCRAMAPDLGTERFVVRMRDCEEVV